ncbi:MAG: pitrilysin family protein [Vampirovibrionales bacterium]|nr:pitrilysin family protein [Vampirovibrionales bacterium]
MMASSTLISPATAQKRRLDNGATLLFQPMPGAPRLSMVLLTPGGNRLDTVAGTADVIDRLLLKGTACDSCVRDQEAIAVEIDRLTLDLDTATKRDFSVMSATLMPEDLDDVLALVSDLYLNTTLAELPNEIDKMIGEIQMDLDAPKSVASDLLIKTIFQETPYGTVGSIMQDSLKQLMADDEGGDLQDPVSRLREHYKQIYRPERLVIAVAGNMNIDTLAEKLTQALPQAHDHGAATGTASWTTLHQLKLSENQQVHISRPDSNQAHIYQAWLAPEAAHDDVYPLLVLNTILGAGGLSSRMFLELRDKQGLAYTVRSSYEAYQCRGLFSLYIGTEPKNFEKCLKGFEEECAKLMNEAVSAQELADAKQNLLGRRSVFLETTSQWASYLGGQYILGRTLEDIANIPQRVQAVTPADIQRVAQAVFKTPSVIAHVGP